MLRGLQRSGRVACDIDVSALTIFLAPALQFLLGVGEHAADRAEESLGEGAWSSARRLWDRLRGKVEEEPGAQSAAEHLAEHPDDPDARAALAFFVRKILAADPALARGVETDWEVAKTQTTAIASAERSAAVIGDANVVITGDAHPQHERRRTRD